MNLPRRARLRGAVTTYASLSARAATLGENLRNARPSANTPGARLKRNCRPPRPAHIQEKRQ